MQAQHSIPTPLTSRRVEEPRARGRAPLVSVCMPSFNHARFLPAAIESVLAQTYPHIECIIVDDGSTDESLEIARSYASRFPGRVKVFTHKGHANRGISATANLAFERASGDYWCGLSSDDAILPDKVERQVAFLEQHPEVGMVYGRATVIDARGRKLGHTFVRDLARDREPLLRLVEQNCLHGQTVMIRRECFEKVGREDEHLMYSDWELWIRIAAHYKVAFLPRTLAYYRVHATNTSVGPPPEIRRERHLEVMKALEAKAPAIGGGLARPRVRALIALQLSYLYFCAADGGSAARAVRSAFEIEPALFWDIPFLAGWLLRRRREVRAFTRPPAGDYLAWFAEQTLRLVRPDPLRADAPLSRRRLQVALLVAHYGLGVRQWLARAGRLVECLSGRARADLTRRPR